MGNSFTLKKNMYEYIRQSPCAWQKKRRKVIKDFAQHEVLSLASKQPRCVVDPAVGRDFPEEKTPPVLNPGKVCTLQISVQPAVHGRGGPDSTGQEGPVADAGLNN